MTWLAIVAAALGGGIIASLLESWFARVRAYETARLQVLNDLDSINAVSGALTRLIARFGDEVKVAELQRMRYPTGTWLANRAVMATRLERDDPDLLKRLSGIFATVTHLPLIVPLPDPLLAELPKLHERLSRARLGFLGLAIVYGPRYAIRQRRR